MFLQEGPYCAKLAQHFWSLAQENFRQLKTKKVFFFQFSQFAAKTDESVLIKNIA